MTVSLLAHRPHLTTPKPPDGLGPDGKRLWLELQSSYGIVDAGGLLLLETAAKSYDDWIGARAILTEEGLTVPSPAGRKAHPAVRLVEVAHRNMMAALRQLHLDVEPLRAGPGRPSGK
jgi:hypothetical protein